MDRNADTIFFDRMRAMLQKAKETSWNNSKKFEDMEDALGKVNTLMVKNVETDDMVLYEALDKLEKSAEKYLEHKVKDGANRNASGKIIAAYEMKDYIRERKSEIYRKQFTNSINAADVKAGDDDFVKKLNEVEVTQRYIRDILENNQKYDAAVDEKISKIFDDAKSESVQQTFRTNGAASALFEHKRCSFNEENLKEFVHNSCDVNVSNAYQRSRYAFRKKEIFNACIVDTTEKIQEKSKIYYKLNREATKSISKIKNQVVIGA